MYNTTTTATTTTTTTTEQSVYACTAMPRSGDDRAGVPLVSRGCYLFTALVGTRGLRPPPTYNTTPPPPLTSSLAHSNSYTLRFPVALGMLGHPHSLTHSLILISSHLIAMTLVSMTTIVTASLNL